MLKQKTSKKGSFAALVGIVCLLALVVLLENIASLVPGLPNVFQPTSQLFTVLKKGAVYSLVAVSMNLLNGFTGLFSLGQAGFMLLGAYTFAILNVPVAAKEQVYYLYGGSAVNFTSERVHNKSIFYTLRIAYWVCTEVTEYGNASGTV